MAPEHRQTDSVLPHLIALGVGAIVGTGILTLTGSAPPGADGDPLLAIAGLICAAALAYGWRR
jgi:APA family basic amino acid/polyamine antiporter